MMKKLVIMGVFLAMAGNIMADNLIMENIEITSGEEKVVTIELQNPDNKFVAFQFDLTLPEGVSIALNDKGMLNATLVESRKVDHMLSVEKLTSGSYRFLSFSMTNTEFLGTSGPLINITLEADNNIESVITTATISKQVFTSQNGTQIALPDVVINVEVETSTGIQGVYDSQHQVIYNMMGVKIDATDSKTADLAKGIYIVNGKKTIVK